MYYAVVDVVALEDFIVRLTFRNGVRKQFDMKPYLNKGIFKELQDPDKFRSVRVCFDTIEWENEADFDPEVLYTEGIEIR